MIRRSDGKAWSPPSLFASLQATCGAGLPVISTLKHLVQTGDQILRIEVRRSQRWVPPHFELGSYKALE